MSTSSKVAVGMSLVATAGIITAVHLKKKYDSEKMREGVYKDLERQERKKRNKELLEEQAKLTQLLQEPDEEDEKQDAEDRDAVLTGI